MIEEAENDPARFRNASAQTVASIVRNQQCFCKNTAGAKMGGVFAAGGTLGPPIWASGRGRYAKIDWNIPGAYYGLDVRGCILPRLECGASFVKAVQCRTNSFSSLGL